MDQRVKISIVVPVYNTGKLLRACVEALLAQDCPDCEIILVDDGSTDDSGAICREYAGRFPERVRVIGRANGGSSAARNSGLDAARGEWIYFSDSDDVAEPEICSHLLRIAEENHADMSCCSLICDQSAGRDIRSNVKFSGDRAVWDRPEILAGYIRPLLRPDAASYAEASGYLHISLFRRDIIEENHLRFITELPPAEDEAFILQYLVHIRRLALSHRVLYHYGAREDSLCARFFKKGRPFSEMEKNWYWRWKVRFEVFRSAGLSAMLPGMGKGLLFNSFYHEALFIAADASRPRKERAMVLRRRVAEVKKEPEYRESGRLNGAQRLFGLILACGWPALWIFCTALRLKKERRCVIW